MHVRVVVLNPVDSVGKDSNERCDVDVLRPAGQSLLIIDCTEMDEMNGADALDGGESKKWMPLNACIITLFNPRQHQFLHEPHVTIVSKHS